MKSRKVAVIGLMLVVMVSTNPVRAADDDGFKPIFDGKTLNGWDGDPTFWRIEDGTITGQTTPEKPTKHNTFSVWRGGELDDFELKFEYRIVGGNSGLQYRSFELPEVAKWVVGGISGRFRGRGYLVWHAL